MKIGRNEPCPCGSGKKFKKCCGRPPMTAASQLSPDFVQRMELELARTEAREHVRRRQQGLGRPIVSFEANGHRFVAVGKELRWNKNWRTFTDFLFDYIKILLTPEWGNAELKKSDSERHPLISWYRLLCEVQKKSALTRKSPNEIVSSPIDLPP